MAVEVNKEVFQQKINELGNQLGAIRNSVSKLRSVGQVEGEGEAYETLKGITEHFANNLDSQLLTLIDNIHKNLQTIYDDFDNKEKEIQKLIEQDTHNMGGAK